MGKSFTTRLEKIKELIDFGLTNDEMLISKYSRALGIKNKSIMEYLEIIDFISKNPIDVSIVKKDRYTHVKLKKMKD